MLGLGLGFPLLGEGAGGGDYVFYFYILCFENGVAEHFPFAFGVRVHSDASLEETRPAIVHIYEADFVGFLEGDASVFPAFVGVAPAEMGVVVMWGHVVAAGFYLFLFVCFGVYAVVDEAFVEYSVFAFVVGFFVADEVFRADEADVLALCVAFGARVFFVGGADDKASRPA